MEENFPDCPRCSLPMSREDNGTFSCPSCSGTFNQDRSDHVPHAGKPNRSWIVPTVISVMIVLIVAFLGVMSLLIKDIEEEGRISFVDVAKIRHLDPLEDIRIVSMSREEYFQLMEERLDRDRFWQNERLMECLLIIDTDLDLARMEVDPTAEGPVCFYDSSSKNIYMIDDDEINSFEEQNLCMAFTHALLDQHFNISHPGSFDMDLAFSGAFRGDWFLTMFKWGERELSIVDRLLFDREEVLYDIWTREMTPLEYNNGVLGEISYFPFGEGYDFVEEVHSLTGWAGVDRFYTDRPPLSSEQVLHLEKYLEYEPPVDVINDPIQGLDLRFETTVGEKLLTEMMPSLEDMGNSSGIGWGGDTFSYFEGTDKFLSVFKTVWDTEEQCEHFHDELVDYVEGKGFFGSGGDLENGEDHITISRYGRTTTMYLSQERDLVNAALEG